MIISLETRLLYYCWLGGFLEGSDNLRQQKMGTATTIRGNIDLDVSRSSTVSFEKDFDKDYGSVAFKRKKNYILKCKIFFA